MCTLAYFVLEINCCTSINEELACSYMPIPSCTNERRVTVSTLYKYAIMVAIVKGIGSTIHNVLVANFRPCTISTYKFNRKI